MSIDITGLRLHNQRLTGARFAKPSDVVRWLGAVQAQEYTDAKWALALRAARASDAAIERELTAGTILRTHVMRPTWHFVHAADIRWLLALTGPRVGARMAPYNRHLELDAGVFRRSQAAIVRALRGSGPLTRQELKQALRRAGVRADSVQRLAHLVMQAEIDAVICSGPRRDNQFTYALLDDRAPAGRSLSRDQALAELARRYFQSHGPAQIADFVWWSGLATSDARRGLAMIERDLDRDESVGKTYWFAAGARRRGERRTCLLGLYDEYLIAYKDRSAAVDLSVWRRGWSGDPMSAPIVVNGRVVGGWKRTLKGDKVAVKVAPFAPLNRRQLSAISDAALAYSTFLDIGLDLSWK